MSAFDPECGDIACRSPAVFRYTWPGRDEAQACFECAVRLWSVSQAKGIPLQFIALFPRTPADYLAHEEANEMSALPDHETGLDAAQRTALDAALLGLPDRFEPGDLEIDYRLRAHGLAPAERDWARGFVRGWMVAKGVPPRSGFGPADTGGGAT